MKRAVFTIIFSFFIRYSLNAQTEDTIPVIGDSGVLQNVKVNAFGSQAKLKDVPSAISVLTTNDLQRFDGMSLLSAMNTVPGVHMDERTPGNYRLSIRGSILRSPAGIRNVKIYWDEIPLTNASGNTYLNMVDINHLQSIEIIKGPASSMYGANTGGALILHSFNSNLKKKDQFNAGLNLGSFSLINEQFGWQAQRKNFYSNLQQSHLSSLGFRDYGSSRKDILKWNANWKINKNQQLSFLSFYANMHFDNPGSLSEDEYNDDPSQIRDDYNTQKAGFTNHTFFFAPSLKSVIGKRMVNISSVSAVHTSFTRNMFYNFEDRNEWNYSARTRFSYKWLWGNISLENITGMEWQYGTTGLQEFTNKNGVADSFLYHDDLRYTQYFFYTQLNARLSNQVILQMGASRNTMQYYFYRTALDTLTTPQKRDAGNLIAPRIGLLYKLTNTLSLYATIAKGFSPPTLSEVRPSNGDYYPFLQPEQGWNYEVGAKGSLLNNHLDLNTAIYYFDLVDAIVSRTDTAGNNYYVNAGGAIQKGVELWLKGYIIRSARKKQSTIRTLNIWNSFTFQPYFFKNYQDGNTDYSGNHLTGIPQFTDVLGVDLELNNNIYGALILNCTSAIPLDDANDIYAKPYQLLQIKAGKEIIIASIPVNIFVGIDNVLNEAYSRGNNINVAGNNYYNPAPGRNFFVGGKLNL
ncbi:MAG: TonB-dependent receptor [Bacteroidetes bacterium]|nr:TonB-dependent receptor [Bacteroidota bacterium]